MGGVAVTGETVGGASTWNPIMEERVVDLVVDLLQEDILSAADNIFGESES